MTQQRLTTKERRLEITEAALQILHTQGVTQLTMRQLAANIGLSEAAVYRHFTNKEEMMEHVASYVFSGPRVKDLPGKNSVREQLHRIMFSQFQFLEANPHATAVVFQEEIFREYPAVQRIFDQHRDAMFQQIAAIVEEGQRAGTVRIAANVRIFTVIFIGTMRQLAAEWRSQNYRGSLLEQAEPVFAELMHLLEHRERVKK